MAGYTGPLTQVAWPNGEVLGDDDRAALLTMPFDLDIGEMGAGLLEFDWVTVATMGGRVRVTTLDADVEIYRLKGQTS